MLTVYSEAGYKALFLSVDVPVLGKRLNEYRNDYQLPEDLSWPNILSHGRDHSNRTDYGMQILSAFRFFWSLTHQIRAWTGNLPFPGLENIPSSRSGLKEVRALPLKSVETNPNEAVNTPEDVEQAIKYKIDGVIISNHGGRQLDSVPATLDALRDCAPVAAGRIPIAIDGGIRRGSDIFKALALGASHCFVGRIPIWGLAVRFCCQNISRHCILIRQYGGQEGVELAIKILLQEFKITMALAGYCLPFLFTTRYQANTFLIGVGPYRILKRVTCLWSTPMASWPGCECICGEGILQSLLSYLISETTAWVWTYST